MSSETLKLRTRLWDAVGDVGDLYLFAIEYWIRVPYRIHQRTADCVMLPAIAILLIPFCIWGCAGASVACGGLGISVVVGFVLLFLLSEERHGHIWPSAHYLPVALGAVFLVLPAICCAGGVMAMTSSALVLALGEGAAATQWAVHAYPVLGPPIVAMLIASGMVLFRLKDKERVAYATVEFVAAICTTSAAVSRDVQGPVPSVATFAGATYLTVRACENMVAAYRNTVVPDKEIWFLRQAWRSAFRGPKQ